VELERSISVGHHNHVLYIIPDGFGFVPNSTGIAEYFTAYFARNRFQSKLDGAMQIKSDTSTSKAQYFSL
jgi:hypothetical protein